MKKILFTLAILFVCFRIDAYPWVPRPDKLLADSMVYERGCGDDKAFLCGRDELSSIEIFVSSKDLLIFGNNRATIHGNICFKVGFVPPENTEIVFLDLNGDVLFKTPIWKAIGKSKYNFSDCDRFGKYLSFNKSHILKISYYCWEFN